jgi:hypothetical protein
MGAIINVFYRCNKSSMVDRIDYLRRTSLAYEMLPSPPNGNSVVGIVAIDQ